MSFIERTKNGSDSIIKSGFLDGISLSEFVYYFAFSLLLLKTSLDYISPEVLACFPSDAIKEICQLGIICLLLGKMVFQKVKLLSWVMAIALIVVGLLSWSQSEIGRFLWIALFIVAGKGVDIKKLATISFLFSALLIVICVSLSILGVLSDNTLERGELVRHSWGFGHPNSLSLYFLNLCIAFSVMRFDKNLAPTILFLLVVTLLNVFVTDSRTVVLITAIQVILLLLFYYVRSETVKRNMGIVLFVLVVICVIASLFFMVSFDSTKAWENDLNNMLSGRLGSYSIHYRLSGLSLFGANNSMSHSELLTAAGYGVIPLDNSYCFLLIAQGIVPFLLFVLLYIWTLYKLIGDERRSVFLYGLVVMALYGFTENCGAMFEFNYFMVVIAEIIIYRQSETSMLQE